MNTCRGSSRRTLPERASCSPQHRKRWDLLSGTGILQMHEKNNQMKSERYFYITFLLYLGVQGEIQAVTTYTDSKNTLHVAVTHNTSGNKRMGANYLTIFEVSEDVMRGKHYLSFVVVVVLSHLRVKPYYYSFLSAINDQCQGYT